MFRLNAQLFTSNSFIIKACPKGDCEICLPFSQREKLAMFILNNTVLIAYFMALSRRELISAIYSHNYYHTIFHLRTNGVWK